MANSRADRYRQQAEESRLQAERSKHMAHKEAWLKLAAQWLHMAEEIDPTTRPEGQPILGREAESKL
jgi:hypothetical protein